MEITLVAHLPHAGLQPLVGDLGLRLGAVHIAVGDAASNRVAEGRRAHVAHAPAVAPDGLHAVQRHVRRVHKQAHEFALQASCAVGFQCLPAQKVGGVLPRALELGEHREANARFHRGVHVAEVGMPMPEILLGREAVDRAVAGVADGHAQCLGIQIPGLAHRPVDGDGVLGGHVQLEAQLAHEGQAQAHNPVASDLDLLARREGEAVVAQGVARGDQRLEQGAAVRALHRDHGHGLAAVLHHCVEATLVEDPLDPLQILGHRVTSSSNVPQAAPVADPVQAGHREVGLDAAPSVAEGRVGHGADRLPLQVRTTEVLHSRVGLRPADEELAEVGLVEDRHPLARRAALLLDDGIGARPTERQVALHEVQITVLLVGRHVGLARIAQPPGALGVGAVVVVGPGRLVAAGGLEPSWPLEAVPGLVHAAAGDQLTVDRGAPGVAPRERLVVREDDGVGLGIALVRAVLDPLGVRDGVRMEAGAVEAEQVHLRGTGRDPGGQLPASTTSQHQPHGVEAAVVVEATHARLRAHERLVVWGEGLGPAHGGLDARLLDDRTSLHMALQVLPKRLVIQLEEPEGEAGVDVGPELWVLLVASDRQGVALGLEVDAQIMVPHIGEAAVHPRDGLRQDHGVLHGLQRNLRPDHRSHLVGPGTTRVDHRARLDAGATGGGHGDDAAHLGSSGRGVGLRLDTLHASVLKDLGADATGSLGVGVGDAGGVDGAVAGRVHAPVDVVHVEQRVDLFHLRR
mmetsp:Transcript_5652/g.15348  ORF Transcript_5652/g.15348 Transcript_5652/m.15348 type:complete len:744 (-) Transcript_5652:271-2502(-)